MIQKIKIDEFLALATQYPVLDVRSPGEFVHAHIPGAHSLPLFTDKERKVVGTAYKQQSREEAIKIGLDYFGVKMRRMVEDAEQLTKDKPGKTVLVHCWRGGMRSAGVAWLLDLYGFKVYTLTGGYKAYRNWVIAHFSQPYSFHILGGYTGSGKTVVLQALVAQGHPVIDLEGLAQHMGSAFGGLGDAKQPSQEMFENRLGTALHSLRNSTEPIWIEDESRRIGQLNIPDALWHTLRRAPLYFLDIPFEQRLNYITGFYGRFKKEPLVQAIMRIQKRLGTLNAKNAVGYLLEDNYTECFRILLAYYDKYYHKGIAEQKLPADMLTIIESDSVNAPANSRKLLHKKD